MWKALVGPLSYSIFHIYIPETGNRRIIQGYAAKLFNADWATEVEFETILAFQGHLISMQLHLY